jgi:stearoyl-CoA 9-desaturase NADPH oxidoreductase
VKSVLSRLWRVFCMMLGNQPALSRYLLPILQQFWPGFIPGQYRARLMSKYWPTTDMLHLTFRVSQRWPGFIPGQHVLLTLHHNGRYLSRPFSICSTLTDWQSNRTIALCCKVTGGAEFTPQLNQLHNATVVNISVAQGDFAWQQPAIPALFIAAGSGITPIAAMLLSQRHWLAPVHLYYRCRGSENAALLAPLQQLAARQSLFTLTFSDSRIQPATELINALLPLAINAQIYLCGPNGFMHQVQQHLTRAGIAAADIHTEQFGPALSVLPGDTLSGDGTASALQTTFIQAGSCYQLAVSSQHSLLQSAEQHGLTPRFGCRMGVCFQCVCDKVFGQVRDMRTGALSGHGTEQIQLCISQPLTDLVIKL